MRILSLNYEGLQNAHVLSDVQRKYNPDVMFLSETHLDDFPADCLCSKLGHVQWGDVSLPLEVPHRIFA
jgi:hypothetical protein